jgi:copper(I)-binding protein
MAAGGDGLNPTMREKEGGIVVPAGGEYTLEPGGDHFMLMDLKEPVLAGQDVTIVVTADDGSTVEFTVVGRSFSGARENYEGDHGDHGGDHEDDHEGDRR